MSEHYIGVDLGGTNLKISIFDQGFMRLSEKRVPTGADLGPSHVLGEIKETIAAVLNERNIANKDIKSIGIGVPGLLDVEKGISLFAPNFSDWADVPVARYIEGALGIPAFIDNDVRVNLYGEWYFGAGKGKQNIVLLTLGTGLGSGVVIDGRVLYGATGSVGEIGHMNMVRQGRPCKCGSSGCLGRYVSAIGLLQTIQEKLDCGQRSVLSDWAQNDHNRITAQMVSEAFDLGDATATDSLLETGEMLGYGLANVINLYNPQIVIIGGGMARAGERLLKRTREVVERHALKIPREACSIVTAALGDSAGMYGAAVYASRRVMKEWRESYDTARSI